MMDPWIWVMTTKITMRMSSDFTIEKISFRTWCQNLVHSVYNT
jgi:hypothetical protein